MTISTEKANIAGKVYFVHKVLPKQTVYSICKAYSITEKELLETNPDIKDGLKAGSIIFVPVSDALQIELKRQAAAAQRKEAAEKEEPSEADTYHVVEHRVRWYESLNMIARKYGVTAAEIVEYNALKSSNVVRGDVLLIPIKGEGDPVENDPEPDTEEVNTPEVSGGQPVDPVAPVKKVHWYSAGEPMHISLVLPLNASGTPSSQFLNFYSGVLMAVREQKDKGAHLVLNVYDLAQGAEAILSDPKFEGSDLVVGPVEAATLAPFIEFSDQNGIPFVSPLDHKADSLVNAHPFFFQVPASTKIQNRNLVASIRPSGDEPVILVASARAEDAAFMESLESALADEGITYRKTGISGISQVIETHGRRATAKVLIGSENKTFATEAINTLNSLAKKNVSMEVWCANRVRNYDTSDPDALFNINAHLAVPYFVDYSDEKDRAFVLQYRALYGTEPDEFAFSGYDIFTYFITCMMQQGSAFAEQADMVPMQLLHCNFHFLRDQKESGWRNHATRHLVYRKDDYSIAITK